MVRLLLICLLSNFPANNTLYLIQCCGLNEKCPPKAQLFGQLVPRWRSLAEGSTPQQEDCQRSQSSPLPFCSLFHALVEDELIHSV